MQNRYLTYKFNEDSKTIETERILMRLSETDDAKRVAFLANNKNIADKLYFLPQPYTEADALEWFENHHKNYNNKKCFDFMITVNNEIIGVIGLSLNVNNGAEIGYWLGEDYWNMGYASEAAEALIEFGFKHLKLHKIYAGHFSSNKASGRVMEKVGMHYEATLKDQIFKNNKYQDQIMYAIFNTNE